VDISKIKLPMLLVMSILGGAALSGGVVATTQADVKAHERKITEIERRQREDRELLIETVTILRRLDRQARDDE
jgi:hypothetical protein